MHLLMGVIVNIETVIAVVQEVKMQKLAQNIVSHYLLFTFLPWQWNL